MSKKIRSQFQNLFDIPIKYFESRLRYTLDSEYQKSKLAGSDYGYVHYDMIGGVPYEGEAEPRGVLGGVVYFNQSISAGTAFFTHPWETQPDIKIGAVRNRTLVYSATRPHACCHDTTVEKRCVLLIGLVLDLYYER